MVCSPRPERLLLARIQALFIEVLSWPSPLQHGYYSSSFLRTSQMNPSLRSGRPVIVCLRIAVVPKDRLVIIHSLPHMIRVAGYNKFG